MTVFDQIRQLDEQKAQLLKQAKQEALGRATQALKDLAELGFHYQLIEDSSIVTIRGIGTRRTGIRNDVLASVKATPGITRADLIDKMGAKGDKSAEQSISNALSALKKAGTISLSDGKYSAA